MFLMLLACEPSDKPPPVDTGSDTDTDTDTTDPDADNDAYPASVDCDDADSTIHPDATETCNEIDDDCDGLVDDGAGTAWYPDADADGYPAVEATIACEPAGDTAVGTDCDDAEAVAYPGAAEACGDIRDYDCDGWTYGCDIEVLPHVRILGDTQHNSESHQIALDGDLDGDGRSDLLIACQPGYRWGASNGNLSVFSGASLTPGAELTMSASPSWTTEGNRRCDEGGDVYFGMSLDFVGDIDGGGGDDFAVTYVGCGASPSDGGFAAVLFVQGEQFGVDWSASAEDSVLLHRDELEDGSIWQVEGGDFSGDGIADIVLTGDELPILYLDGAGFSDWSDGRTLDELAEGSIACTEDPGCWYYNLDASADFDGDGQEDIVFTSGNDLYVTQHTPGPGESAADVDIVLSVAPEDTFLPEPAGDIDGDGLPELIANRYDVTGDTQTYELAVFTGSQLATAVTVDDWTWHIPDAVTAGSVGDVDGDGTADLGVYFHGYEEPIGSAAWLVSGPEIVAGADPSRIRGPYLYDQAGCFVGRGDVDADGFDDLILCSYGDTSSTLNDEYFVMFGG